MNLSDYYIILVIGIVVSLLLEEFVGVSSGGMIVPAVLAYNLNNVDIIIYIFLLSFATYFIVDKVLTKHMILFGKRKFAFMVLVSLLLKLIGDQFYPFLPFATIAFRGIGVITPALLATTYTKQGIKFTVPTALLSTFIVYSIMSIIRLI